MDTDRQHSAASPPEGRTARKRRAILDAAAEVFLQNGYLGASMDQVAALAAVSKQTVYKQFADKESLFSEVVLSTTSRLVSDISTATRDALDDADDPEEALLTLARWLLAGLLSPDVLRLRRLVIAEADRFPAICQAWYEAGFAPSLAAMGESLGRLADRGLLRDLDDPLLAAHQFAGLVMYKPMNQVMFSGLKQTPPADEQEQLAASAVRVFLAAYGATA